MIYVFMCVCACLLDFILSIAGSSVNKDTCVCGLHGAAKTTVSEKRNGCRSVMIGLYFSNLRGSTGAIVLCQKPYWTEGLPCRNVGESRVEISVQIVCKMANCVDEMR